MLWCQLASDSAVAHLLLRQLILFLWISEWNPSGSPHVDVRSLLPRIEMMFLACFFWPRRLWGVSEMRPERWISDIIEGTWGEKRIYKKNMMPTSDGNLGEENFLLCWKCLVHLLRCHNRCHGLFWGRRGWWWWWWCAIWGQGSSWVSLETSNKEKHFWKSWFSESHIDAICSRFSAEIIIRTPAEIEISQNLSPPHLL